MMCGGWEFQISSRNQIVLLEMKTATQNQELYDIVQFSHWQPNSV